MASTRLFISYARADGRDLALRLHADLHARDYDVWLDTAALEGGASWSADIERAIDGCDVALALLTPGSYVSEICRAEHLRALRQGKRVIPVLVDANADRPLYLEHLNHRDFSDQRGYHEALIMLINDITSGAHTPLPRHRQQTRVTNAPPEPPHFLPRPDVLNRLRDAVTSDVSESRIGITALRGMGGIGKTVMAAALCRDQVVLDAYPDGVVWVTIGQNPGSLLIKLRDLLRALGEIPASNASQDEMVSLLRTTLPKQAALIVLDDIWDAQHVEPFIVSDAPNARLLFTTRNSAIVTALGAHEHCLDVLDEDEAGELLAQWADVSPAALPPEAPAVADECGYLPLALALCGAMVRGRPDRWQLVLHRLQTADLAKIRQRFPNYDHTNVLSVIQVSVEDLDPAHQARYFDFAVFPQDVPLSEATLITLWEPLGLDEYDTVDVVDDLVDRSLVLRDEDGGLTLHDLQVDYVCNAEVRKDAGADPLAKLHATLLDAYHAKCDDGWSSGPNDGYFFEYLAYHLHASGRRDDLYALLTASPDWMEAKFAACVGDTSYAADLTLGLADFNDPLDPDQLIPVTRLHTAQQVVRARAGSYTNEDLTVLVWLGRDQEATSHARLRSDPAQQRKGLMVIYIAQCELQRGNSALLYECLMLVEDVQDVEQRTLALSSMAEELARAGLRKSARLVASRIQSAASRSAVLAVVAEELAQVRQSRQAARNASQAHRDPDAPQSVSNQVATLSREALASARAGRVRQADYKFRRAHEVATSTNDAREQIEGLSELAARLSQAGRDAEGDRVFQQARALAEGIHDRRRQAGVLRVLAAGLAQAGFVKQACDVAASIQSVRLRSSALRSMAVELVQSGQHEQAAEVFYRAREIVEAIRSEQEWTAALRAVSDRLTQEGFYNQAHAVAVKIDDVQLQAFAVAAVAAALAQTGQVDSACALADEIQDARGRVVVFSRIAEGLIEVGHYAQAVEAAEGIRDAESRSRVLRDIAAELPGTKQTSKIARKIAQSFQSGEFQTFVLCPAITGLARTGQIEHAAAVAACIPDKCRRAAVLQYVATWLAQAGRDQQAFHVTAGMKDTRQQVAVLVSVAASLVQDGQSALATDLLLQAHILVERIKHEAAQQSALQEVAIGLAQAGQAAQAREVANSIKDVRLLETTLDQVAEELANPGQSKRADTMPSDVRSSDIFAMMDGVQDEQGPIESMETEIDHLIQAGRVIEAFDTLDAGSLDNFIQSVAAWNLPINTLFDVIRIAGWHRSDWREIHDLLTAETAE